MSSAARSFGSCLYAFSLRKPFLASSIAAAVQRKAIDAERQRFTLRLTRRTVPIMFSMMLVHARDLLSSQSRPTLGRRSARRLAEPARGIGRDPHGGPARIAERGASKDRWSSSRCCRQPGHVAINIAGGAPNLPTAHRSWIHHDPRQDLACKVRDTTAVRQGEPYVSKPLQ